MPNRRNFMMGALALGADTTFRMPAQALTSPVPESGAFLLLYGTILVLLVSIAVGLKAYADLGPRSFRAENR